STSTNKVVKKVSISIIVASWEKISAHTLPLLGPFRKCELIHTKRFSVTWSGSDATSGIAGYDIYVSDNGAPYTLWQSNVVITAATYSAAVNGHTYRFYSRARDRAGNYEVAPATPDAQTLVSVDGPTSAVSPLSPYQTTNSFLVMWSGNDATWGVRDYTIYVSVDNAPYTVWLSNTTHTAAYYTGAHGRTYAFYSRARNNANVVEAAPASPDTTTTVDTVRPTSAVSPLPRYSTIPTITVRWSGSDNGSGLAFYDVYMADTGSMFNAWRSATTITSSQHIGSDGHEYTFYSLATDRAGNVQDRPTVMALTLVDLTPPASSVSALPPIHTTTSFTVSWSGVDPSPGIPSGLATYDVYVSVNGGAYELWQSGVDTTMAVFTGVQGSTYRFYSIARDKAGNVESAPLAPDAETRIQMGGRIYLPVVLRNRSG
ncbi:MAG: hypothetical protein N2508_06830, partial [Anaerolineae bacterium]|nr:hypothetical protein [Anaerolineae bacterium]